MNKQKALALVLEIATENALDPEECDPELVAAADEQHEALSVVDDLLDSMTETISTKTVLVEIDTVILQAMREGVFRMWKKCMGLDMSSLDGLDNHLDWVQKQGDAPELFVVMGLRETHNMLLSIQNHQS